MPNNYLFKVNAHPPAILRCQYQTKSNSGFEHALEMAWQPCTLNACDYAICWERVLCGCIFIIAQISLIFSTEKKYFKFLLLHTHWNLFYHNIPVNMRHDTTTKLHMNKNYFEDSCFILLAMFQKAKICRSRFLINYFWKCTVNSRSCKGRGNL